MKHKEKEHLKDDPLVDFIEKVLAFFRANKRKIYMTGAVIAAAALIVAAVFIIRSGGYSRDNRIFSAALKIKTDSVLTAAEKIARLKKLGKGSGLAASTVIYIAQVHYDSHEWQQAYDSLKDYRQSRFGYINDNKKLLEAEILMAMGKKPEAEGLIASMLSDGRTEIGKDYLLLKLAKMKLADGQAEAAKTELQKLVADFPESPLGGEAQNLLAKFEEN